VAADLANLKIRVDAIEASNATRELDKMTAAGAKAEKSAGALSGAFGALAGVLAVLGVTKAVESSIMLAARYETLGVVMGVLGNNAGYTRAQMDEFQKTLQDTGISMIAARDSLNMMAAAQLDLGKASQLARAAQDAAVIAGINSSEAFQRMTRGIQSGELEILKTMGIMVSWEDGYKRLAPTIGKTVDTLTAQEKALLRQQIVLDDAAKKSGAYEASMGTAGKQMQSMKRYVEDLQVKFGTLFQPALTALVFDLSKGIKDVSEGLSEWAGKNEGSVREFVDSITIAARAAGDLVKDIGLVATATGEAGVESGFFARTLQMVAIILNGLDATVRAVAGTFAQFTAWTIKNFTTPFIEAENSLRRMAKLTQTDLLFNIGAGKIRKLDAAATGLDLFGSEQADVVSSRWEKLMQSLETAGVIPKVKVVTDNVKKEAGAHAEASAEAKRHADALVKLVERYREERANIGMSADVVERLKAQKMGANQATLDFIVATQNERNALEAESAAIKKQVDLRQQMFEKAQEYIDLRPERPELLPSQQRTLDDARNLGLDTETPEERTARGLKHLDDMLNTGAIPTLEAYRRRWIELQRSAGGSLENIALVMQTVTDRMGQAFSNFVTTGKMQFKELVSSILAELARLYAQKAFAQLLEIGLGAFFSAGGNSLGGAGAGSQTGSGTGPFNGDGSGMSGGTGYGLAPGSTQEAPQISTTITVNVQEGTAKSDTQTSGKGGVDLGRLIDAKVRGVLMDEMRPNGLLNPGRA